MRMSNRQQKWRGGMDYFLRSNRVHPAQSCSDGHGHATTADLVATAVIHTVHDPHTFRHGWAFGPSSVSWGRRERAQGLRGRGRGSGGVGWVRGRALGSNHDRHHMHLHEEANQGGGSGGGGKSTRQRGRGPGSAADNTTCSRNPNRISLHSNRHFCLSRLRPNACHPRRRTPTTHPHRPAGFLPCAR